MIPRKSFLKEIPRCVEVRQRLSLQGVAYAIDSVYWSFSELKKRVLLIRKEPETWEQPSIFVNCWSIIDQAHMLRMLLIQMQPESRSVLDFIAKYENVTLIRNCMDHLHQRIGNLAAAKVRKPPIFGVFSFCRVAETRKTESGGLEMTECDAVTITSGLFTRDQLGFSPVNPAGKLVENPVGLFQFEAFDYKVDLSELIRDLTALVTFFDTKVRADIEQAVRDEASKLGEDAEKILADHAAGSLYIALRMRFEESGEELPKPAQGQADDLSN